MQIKARVERQKDQWLVECPELGGLSTTAPRLDKAEALIKNLAAKQLGEEICDIVVDLEMVMPGIVCDIESAKAKMHRANELKEEAANEMRDVVRRAREQGLKLRDIAVLLNVTPQRVAQLIDSTQAD